MRIRNPKRRPEPVEGSEIRNRKSPSLFWSSVVSFAVFYLLVRFGIPYASMLIIGAERPLTVPGTLQTIYVLLILIGFCLYIGSNAGRMQEFAGPILALLRGREAAETSQDRLFQAGRLAVLIAVPLLIGWTVYSRQAPRVQTPTAIRVQHPGLPKTFEDLENPLRAADPATQAQYIEEGRTLYMINCRPCHGTKANGAGPMAPGFRLKPADFTDPGTIATVVENYAFWRVRKGGLGLPSEATPWDSAMPVWERDLTDEEIWKIIMAEYEIADKEPRKPEGTAMNFGFPRAGTVRNSEFGFRVPVAAAQGEPDVEAGEAVYLERCVFCHGEEGDGNGPVAPYLNPRPRDFTRGLFKLRTTDTGEPPLDSDLIETVKSGIPGTAMPSWQGTLTDEEIRNVVAYVKELTNRAFEQNLGVKRFDPEFPPVVVEIPEPPEMTDELIARGKEIYERVECWKCHGSGGHADGESSPELEDDWGFFIRARDMTKGWQYKGGATIKDIYTRFSTGMDGTPMPSFLYDLPDDMDRWALAAYVATFVREQPGTGETVLQIPLISGDLPTDPDDPAWEQAETLSFPMSGQVLARPRWQTPSVDQLDVKALYNGQEIALLLMWNDPFKDTVHQVEAGGSAGLDGTYVDLDLYGRALHRYRDAVAVQFPGKIPEGSRKPHFLRGKKSEPVNLWMWKADRQENAGQASSVEEYRGLGHLVAEQLVSLRSGEAQSGVTVNELMDQLLEPQPPESQNVAGNGVWQDGRWKVVLRRALDTGDPEDIRLEPGALIPVAFQAWDGSNGERGLLVSISSWYFLRLESPTPLNAYLFGLIGVMLTGVGEWWLVRRLRR